MNQNRNKKKIRNILELNENESPTYPNLRVRMYAVLREIPNTKCLHQKPGEILLITHLKTLKTTGRSNKESRQKSTNSGLKFNEIENNKPIQESTK